MNRFLLITIAGSLVGLGVIGCKPDSDGETTTTEPATGGPGATSPAVTTVSFSSVQELLNTNCIGCHGETKPKEDLNLTSYETLMKGGEHGAVVVPGDPENSRIVHALRGSHGMERMPKEGDALAEAKIAEVEGWIRQGAKNE